jgi:hypothetical protein
MTTLPLPIQFLAAWIAGWLACSSHASAKSKTFMLR